MLEPSVLLLEQRNLSNFYKFPEIVRRRFIQPYVYYRSYETEFQCEKKKREMWVIRSFSFFFFFFILHYVAYNVRLVIYVSRRGSVGERLSWNQRETFINFSFQLPLQIPRKKFLVDYKRSKVFASVPLASFLLRRMQWLNLASAGVPRTQAACQVSLWSGISAIHRLDFMDASQIFSSLPHTRSFRLPRRGNPPNYYHHSDNGTNGSRHSFLSIFPRIFGRGFWYSPRINRNARNYE